MSNGAKTSASALTAQSSDGAAPSAPQATPMPNSGQRPSRSSCSRSSRLAWSARTSCANTRYVSQPQISGGSTRTSGGTNQNGMLTTSATKAMAVQPSETPSPATKPAPWRRSRRGKRRAATSRTIAGVISSAATSSETTTNTGTASATTTSGATTLAQPAAPIERSQAKIGSSNAVSSSQARTSPTAGSQNQ